MRNNFEKYHDHIPELYELEKKDDATLLIKPAETGQGTEIIKINAFSRSFISKTQFEIKLLQTGINGIEDGLDLTASSYYFLYATFNDTATDLEGFALIKQPKATTTAVSSGTKGSEATFTVARPQGYQFTTGAKVSVYVSESEWNTGTIVSENETSVKIVMDNETYGDDITTAASTITQYNKFRPYHCVKSISEGTSTTCVSKYKLLETYTIYSDSSSDLEIVKNLGLGYNCYGWWDKSRYTHNLHFNYMEANGNYVINPLSPLVGLQTRDLLSDDRFIRADSTSGTTQDADIQNHYHRTAIGHDDSYLYMYGATRPSYGSDVLSSVSKWTQPVGTSGTGAVRLARTDDTPYETSGGETRPINISMVPVVRII